MKEIRRQPEDAASTNNTRLTALRVCLWGLALSAIVVLTLAIASYWHGLNRKPDDPYATLQFRPRITYNSSDVTVINTEGEPYLDTKLTLYVAAIAYSVSVGTVRPGESLTRSLSVFTDEHGNNFDPAKQKAILLEVKARMGGYDVHKDFPPPPQ
jgi:hypothetical protein